MEPLLVLLALSGSMQEFRELPHVQTAMPGLTWNLRGKLDVCCAIKERQPRVWGSHLAQTVRVDFSPTRLGSLPALHVTPVLQQQLSSLNPVQSVWQARSLQFLGRRFAPLAMLAFIPQLEVCLLASLAKKVPLRLVLGSLCARIAPPVAFRPHLVLLGV